jgi:DNA-binding beta-propeller fold protein YncE
VANPLRDTVAVIDSETLRVESVEAGDGPTYLETTAGVDQAIVLNVGSKDATIIRTGERESTTSTVAVVPGSNAIAIAPDGRHAVVYFDTARRGPGLGSGSFQDVTLIRLDEAGDTTLNVSVGFRPSRVIFQPDSSAAYLVTEDGVSILRFAELTGPTIVPTVSVGDDPFGQLSRDVSITPDGTYALARREGETSIRLVELATGDIEQLDLGGQVTDLDITPSGTSALAVIREHSTLVRLPLPEAFADPSGIERFVIPGEWVGSVAVAPDGDYAVLFTTSAPVERATIVDLVAGETRTVRLRKSVRAITVAPTGGTAMVVHTAEAPATVPPPPTPPGDAGVDPDAGLDTDGGLDVDAGTDAAMASDAAMDLDAGADAAMDLDAGADAAMDLDAGADLDAGDDAAVDAGLGAAMDAGPPPPPPAPPRDPATEELERQIDLSFGYSLIDLASGFTKLQLTDEDVGPVAIVPDGSHAFALFRNDAAGVREVQRIVLASFRVERTRLGSPPQSLGVVGDTFRVFVGQEHPEGRITFFDWRDGDSEAVTGFELNSRTVE